MAEGSIDAVARSSTELQPATRLCIYCELPIPEVRMRATKGRAIACVPCLEIHGDVPPLKRCDELTPDGVVETLFTSNHYVEQQVHRLHHISDNAFPHDDEEPDFEPFAVQHSNGLSVAIIEATENAIINHIDEERKHAPSNTSRSKTR